MSRERIPEVERLRGIAFLAVVLQHSIAHYTVEPGITTGDGILMAVLLMVTKFAVPVFIFITGMVLFYNDKGSLHYGRFIQRRFGDIYIPFAVWTLITLLINNRFNPTQAEDWKYLGGVLLTGKSSSHFWYIIMLFQFYLLYPLFRSAILGIKERWGWRTQLIILLLSGLLYVGLTGVISDIGRWMGSLDIPVWSELFTTYADRNALYYFFYFALGAAAGLYHTSWKKWIQKARTGIWLIFLFLFGWMLIQAVNEIRSAENGAITFYSLSLLRPMMSVFLISSILVMYDVTGWICRQGGARVNSLLTSVGLYSYGAYLMHLLTLRISYVVDESWLISMPTLIRILSSWLISAAAAYGATRLLAMLPFGKWLVGMTGKRKNRTLQPSSPSHSSTTGM
ncbi:acyltransferase [Paenibacillus glucanolyticus]|jgi:surface polysaccharide O-acyltransferase-like enzyme|uniref:acyltransferase n=1 Tax=Paenibacillus TaxID=44249 RepID=UPI0003E25197|nr:MULTISPECIES: acyltransferase [Paenibacillus]ANA83048.1 acyltransferase [Paenibacillus glucanolyticus]AVV57863.1 acyltransferase [Paenibacillus glucanolyticus]ETT34651.1 acyltransferase 3 [Paenibacillus sp. FSL R5-808]OMF83336.1 acyltransferase [Paenibacillus glucanolyticus]